MSDHRICANMQKARDITSQYKFDWFHVCRYDGTYNINSVSFLSLPCLYKDGWDAPYVWAKFSTMNKKLEPLTVSIIDPCALGVNGAT